ncbi:uncharacterized protein LOC118598760 [Oryzias melastigma]|uniref:uncharacterized protein LOC118598760 n=1 Tax=Oryzias melastigma TaxID=30732 RepID=UPI00168D84C8|nr:uncharacterized protein LOC118598760 [Oryzias melastigma]
MWSTMKLQYLFLLVYMLGTFSGKSRAERNPACTKRDLCNEEPDAAFHFLQCAGLPSTDSGSDHMQKLKGVLEATMDVYSFMRSSLNGVPLLSLEGELELNERADPFQNEALVQMWLEVKMKPLLKSITKHFLSCLSTKNFSCSTYQTVLMELSYHHSELTPAQQKWIYTFFMHPFLSGDRIQGCVDPEESSEEWLLKNFGAFRAMARMKDFSALNMVFSGLEVLHLLSPAQKAELLMRPEVESFENGTLSLIFHSLTGSSEPTPTAHPGDFHSGTTPAEYSTFPSYPTQPTHQSHPRSPIENLREVFSGFLTAFKPVGSFVHEFVSFTSERNLSEIRSTTMTQFLLNWTLAELADMYQPKDMVPAEPQFDVTNVEDWYQQVVMPLLQRFLPNNEILEHPNIKLAFHQLFYLDHGVDDAYSEDTDYSEIQDVCSITLDKTPCGLTDAVENVAHVLHCAARTNLTLNEETIMRLILELTKRLNSLIKELSKTNFKEVSSEIKEIFGEGEAPSLTQEHLKDPDFIQLWFQIKLLPLLPDVHPDLLSCLSSKNFSCPVYQTLVSALGGYMSFMEADPMYSQNIYKYFIYSFLQQHNFSDCGSTANNSAEWLQKNVGFFSKFASIIDFYELNRFFSGLEALHLLTPNQTAEMLLLPLRTPPERDVVISHVLNYLIESPEDRKLLEVLHFVIQSAQKVNPPCSVYKLLVDGLYAAIPSLPSDLEPSLWALISHLINIAPENCLTVNFMCPQTHVNGTNICKDIDSSDLEFYMNMSTHVPCTFTLDKYACAQLENFAADQLASLLRCDLPGNSSRSRVLWKLLLTKLSNVLDPALDLLANMSVDVVSPSAPEILDVIGEMRVFLLTDQQLMDSSVVKLWFSERLSVFLPSASEMFLLCLSSRNLSCQSFQQIVQVFSHQFRDMTFQQQHVILKDFILRFLSEPYTGPGCVSASNSSAEWLSNNLGSFSELLSVSEMFDLNPQFNPMEALSVLSPKQSAELLVLKHPTLPNTDVIINKLFDYFTESPRERKFTEFLSFLVVFLEMGETSCSSYETLFTRLDNTSSTSSPDIASSIMDTKVALFNYIPTGKSLTCVELQMWY